ncbi:MAG TPA: WD40 repeat domain-containing protein, partial [Planctomycetota bacterium]|nr:WD40 repeat domain-containing protein [Planctomycetota bacterium]
MCLWAMAGLVLTTSLAAQGTTPDTTATKQTRVFGVGTGGTGTPSGPSVECVVSFGPAVPISAVAFSPDGKVLAVGGYREVLLWDLTAAQLSKRIGTGQLDGRVAALAFIGKGPLLAVADGIPGKSGAVRIFDVNTGTLSRTIPGPTDTVHCLAVSPDGTLLAAGGAYTEAHVWSLADAKLVHTIKGHDDWVTGVAFSPDGTLLATGSLDKSVQIWKVETWEQVTRGGSPEPLHGVAFEPNGRSVAGAVGGPSERAVHIWQTNNARRSRPVPTGGGMPLSVHWPVKSSRFYTGCSDGTIRTLAVWSAPGPTFRGHTDWVYTVAVSDDGARVASGSADGTVRLWTAADGKLLATFLQLVPRTDQWLIMTTQGYVATSSAEAVRWRTKDASTLPDGLPDQLQNVESVRKVLAGEKVAPPVLKQKQETDKP